LEVKKKGDAMTLHPEHLENLRSSGLTDEMIRKMGCVSVRPATIPKHLGFNDSRIESVLCFPYPNVSGFCRDKIFPTDLKTADGHSFRYSQKKNSGSHLYVLDEIKPMVSDIKETLVITEGEKKTALLVQLNQAAIGLGGVWNWMRSGEPIPELDKIPWLREVEICFDSDAFIKTEVMRAMYALGKELESRGAQVSLIFVPPKRGDKTGIDDYLLSVVEDVRRKEFDLLKRLKLNRLATPELRDWFEAWNTNRPQGAGINGSDLSQEERSEALGLLHRKDLLLQFLEDAEAVGCAGENNNKVQLFLGFISRKLSQPISNIIKGESSAGKNFLVNKIKAFIPPEDVISISSATPKAFFYFQSDLCHKVIIIAEAPGGDDAEYSIRTFQSEGELTILVPMKDKSTGTMATQEIKVKGPVGFVITTTKAHLHTENENRSFDIFIDETEEQTKRIFAVQDSHYLRGQPDVEKITKAWRNAQRFLKPMIVTIPFVEHIKFPSKPVRVRRDRPRFLALMEGSALLHQYQREKTTINNVECIVATIDDYAIAYEIVGKTLTRMLKGLTPKCENIVEVASHTEGSFKQADLDAELKVMWGSARRETVKKYLEEACNLGLIERAGTGEHNAYLYKFVRKPDFQEMNILPTPDEIKAKIFASCPVLSGQGVDNINA
jgi:hypothetical protein